MKISGFDERRNSPVTSELGPAPLVVALMNGATSLPVVIATESAFAFRVFRPLVFDVGNDRQGRPV
jgi:hypothetical protein